MTPIRKMHLDLAHITEPDRLILMEACAAASDPIALTLLAGRFAIARATAEAVDPEALQAAIDTLTGELEPLLP